MRNTLRAWVRRCTAALVVLALQSCGGGGGGAGTTGPSAADDLVPLAAAPGAVLYADASVLRPLLADSRRVYRGSRRESPAHLSVGYMNTVTQAAAAGGGFTETASNGFDQGVDSIPIRLAGGNIVSSQVVDLGLGGGPLAVDVLVLKSPVRAGEQTTLLVRRIEGATPDIDADGTREAVDLAVFQRVVGEETVTLLDGATLRAVRVEQVTRARLQLSKDGRLRPVVEIVLTSWHAPGIGIVKQGYVASSAGVTGARAEETLVSWDGLTDGYGLSDSRVLRLPTSDPTAPGAAVGGLRAAVRSGDGVVALTLAPPPSAGVSLLRLDRLGRVVGGSSFPDWQPGGGSLIAPVGDGVVVVQPDSTPLAFRLVAFGADLRTLTDTQGVPLDLGPAGGGVSAVAGEGDRLWVLFQRAVGADADLHVELVLRAFDAAARPVAESQVLDRAPPASGFPSVRLAARDGRVVACWTLNDSGGRQRCAVVAQPGAVPAVSELGAQATLLEPNLHVLAAGGSPSVFWTGTLDTVRADTPPDGRLRGVVLGADALPLRTRPGGIDAELLATAWPAELGIAALDGDDRHLVIAGGTFGRAWPEDSFENTMNAFAIIDQGVSALPDRSAQARFRLVRPGTGAPDWATRQIFVLGDCVLMLGSTSSSQAASALLWLR